MATPILTTCQPVILASSSPRRRKLLSELGLKFRIVVPEVDESRHAGEDAKNYVQRLARNKAEVVGRQFAGTYILAADTVVCCDDWVLGKPNDADEALDMLSRLVGRCHSVLTGYCIYNQSKKIERVSVVETRVWFGRFEQPVLKAYINSGESFDKAGGYGIQGKGAFLVERIDGSYTNVVGLPVAEIIRGFSNMGVVVPCSGSAVQTESIG